MPVLYKNSSFMHFIPIRELFAYYTISHEEEQASQNQRDLFGLNQAKEDIYGGAE